MIVVDSSALLAILFLEADADAYLDQISATECLVSVVNKYETAIVMRTRRGAAAVEGLWSLLSEHNIQIAPFDGTQMRASVAAYNRFGKGIHSRARLNLCDCVAYALAKSKDVPLLFKGDDFAQTDIAPAL